MLLYKIHIIQFEIFVFTKILIYVVVLMSATADIARYREYFKDLGKDERVEVLAIPSSPQHTIHQQRVSYLEQVG